MEVIVELGDIMEALPRGCKDALWASGEQMKANIDEFILERNIQDGGGLKQSGSAPKHMDKGIEFSWNTVYAKRRYYEPCTPSIPGRTFRWAEKAADVYADQWAKMIAKEASM